MPSGGYVIPGAQAFSEWMVHLGGGIATCVESSELVLLHILAGVPLTAGNDIALTQQLQQLGQAGAQGATNWYAASQQMQRLGIPNTPYGNDWFSKNNWQPVVDAALAAGRPILFGLGNANQLFDTWTGKYYDQGVYGHAIAIVGKDASGYIVADPNAPQAQSGGFVHYTAADLNLAGASSMDVPTVSPSSLLPGSLGVPGLTLGSGQPVSAAWWQQVAQDTATGAALSFNPIPGSIGGAATNTMTQAGEGIISWLLRGLGFSGFADMEHRVLLMGLGGLILLVGLLVFFFAGRVGGASPATHVARGSEHAAQGIAAAATLAG